MAVRTKTRSPSGKLHAYGTLVLDMRLKKLKEFRGMSLRLKKATGIPASARNAVEIVKQMKLMIRELERKRDVMKLRAIQNGDLKLLSALVLWQEGRLDLAEAHGDKKILKHWRDYINTEIRREVTRRNRLVIVAALENHGFISGKNVLSELPSLLRKIHVHYKTQKQFVMFNTVRIELLLFLKKGLGLEDDSTLVLEIKKIPRLDVLEKRKHHPFLSPRDCRAFCSDVQSRKSVHAEQYVETILFLCLHGLRPTELEKIEIDPSTKHLKVTGTKNKNADRIVPLVVRPDELPARPPKIDTLNKLFERMGSPVRVRDFRRTYSRWTKESGISYLHYKVYLGHGNRSVTELYQEADPDQRALDEDADKLREWFEAELKKTPTKRETPKPVSTLRFKMDSRKQVGMKKLLEDWMVADRKANPSLQKMEAAGDDED
jgi:hypothetical protein